MNKTYTIISEYSPAYELVVSFYTYVYHQSIKGISLGTEWREQTRQQLPSKFAKELEDERWEVLHRTVLLISQCPDKSSVEAFLAWFEQLPAGELYERLSPWVNSIPLNLGEIRERSSYLLSEWNEHYFKGFDTRILAALKKESALKGKLARIQDPVDLVESAANGMRIEPVEHLQSLILIPQYHCSPSAVLDFYRGMATCLYPFEKSVTVKSAESVILPITQALADERRLAIIQHLAETPRTLIELTKHVKLAKSTVHHHMVLLRRSGIVRAHYVGNTTAAYYSIRDGFVEVLTIALSTLLDKGNQTDETSN